MLDLLFRAVQLVPYFMALPAKSLKRSVWDLGIKAAWNDRAFGKDLTDKLIIKAVVDILN